MEGGTTDTYKRSGGREVEEDMEPGATDTNKRSGGGICKFISKGAGIIMFIYAM